MTSHCKWAYKDGTERHKEVFDLEWVRAIIVACQSAKRQSGWKQLDCLFWFAKRSIYRTTMPQGQSNPGCF